MQELTIDQLRDLISAEAKNLGMDSIGEKIKEEVTKRYQEWEQKSQSDRFKASLFGNAKDQIERSQSANMLAKMLPAIVRGDVSKEKAIEAAKAKGWNDVVKALEGSTFSAGGALIPENYSGEVIRFLYNSTAVRALGANVIELTNDNLTLGRQNATATAYWMGEGSSLTASEQTFGQLRLAAKKLGIFVPISNDLLDNTPMGFESMIQSDIVAVASIAEDSKFIRGDGSSDTPKGILSSVASGQKFNGNSTFNLANAVSDLLKAMYKVESANIPMQRLGWMFNPRTKYALMTLPTSDGYFPFKDELSSGTLFGVPYRTTNSIPKNLGGSSNASEIYFGDFAQAVIGQSKVLEVRQSDVASYIQGGNTIHGFQDDISVVRLIHKVDFVLRHDTAFSVIEAVSWGSSLDS